MAQQNTSLGIVIPLKAKLNSRNWTITSNALGRTLDAIANQKSKNYHCVVIGHTKPRLKWEQLAQKNINFLTVDNFDAVPFLEWLPADRQQAITKDKNAKILQGVKLLANRAPEISHWFVLDADDILATEFVSFILKLNPKSGALLSGGYTLDAATNRIRKRKRIYEICGSTSVLANHVVSESLVANGDVPWSRYSHAHIDKLFSMELKVDYAIIEDPLVCYLTNHGDNCSTDYIQQTRTTKRLKDIFLTKKRTDDFNLRFSSLPQ